MGDAPWPRLLSRGIQWGPAACAENVYTALSDIGFLALKGIAAKQEVDAKSGGRLFALNLATGKRVWATPNPGCGDRPGCSPEQSAAVTVIPGVVFSGSVDGHLRAYSTKDGRILWDIDTIRDYQTVNGVKAKGGAIDGPGPVVVGVCSTSIRDTGSSEVPREMCGWRLGNSYQLSAISF
jgi:polyvinyl alcohol dehydrogenase (cytochrome)